MDFHFHQEPRKVHLFHNNEGLEYRVGGHSRKFANTLCKMNSDVPSSHITENPDRVDCKICRRDKRFKEAQKQAWVPGVGAEKEKKFRHRVNWRGRLILQVLETGTQWDDPSYGNGGGSHVPYMTWRDATLADLNMGVV